jgi:hypothetical protein
MIKGDLRCQWRSAVVRTSQEVLEVRASLVEEMSGGGLPDARLRERRVKLIQALEQNPDKGFPEALGSDDEVEALYRFLRNKRLGLESVLKPHVLATRERCLALGEVLVLHDTTEVSFSGETPRTGLSPLGKGRQGFWLHCALAVSADGLRAPLGLLSAMPMVRPKRAKSKGKPHWRERFEDPDKESRRWATGVEGVRELFSDKLSAIHVMDREGDSYELFAGMLEPQDRFVIRLNHDRRLVSDDPDPCAEKLSEALAQAPVLFEREVFLSPRSAGNRPKQSLRKHPPREGRVAKLRFAARRVALKRPHGYPSTLPASLTVHVVHGWEVDPPAGQEPVQWRLLTTEPIDTIEQVMRVVDIYRARWLIEEFFKALKTGCAYEKRQLESLQTLLVAFGLLAPIAWQMLALRYLARELPDAPAQVALTPRQIQVLRASPAGAKLPKTPSVKEALYAVARLGGHLRQNGQPGWLVLGRGMQKLLWMEQGWVAATARHPM